MRRAIAMTLVLVVLGWTAPAGAKIGTIDQVPGATLLLPYFEVNLDDQNGVQTLFSINNASATAVLAHVTIWSDLSVPMLFFDVYLTGYDVQTINLRDIFVNGQLPYPKLQDISPDYLPHLQQGLTGGPSPIYLGKCAGQARGDRIARGYVTVDTVNSCNLLSPADFLTGYQSYLTNQNVLWGDYFYVNSGQNFAQGETLVSIEASPTSFVPGDYTFYGRYNGFTAQDAREPLATNFAARFLNGGSFTGGTSLVVWRDSKVNQQPFNCPATPGVRPPWYPLGLEGLVVFDEQENPSVITTFPVAPQPPSPNPIPFPAEANRTRVGSADLPAPFPFGWIYLNLNVAGGPLPEAQAWVVVTHDASGRFSVGYDAIQLDNANTPVHTVPAAP